AEAKCEQTPAPRKNSAAGVSFNASTNSGANDLHGAAFAYVRNDKMDARNFFARKRDILKRNQFGGVFGGPLAVPKVYNGRNRTFIFLSYDAERQSAGVVYNNILPSAAMLRGDFSGSGLSRVYDPLSTQGSGGSATRTQFPGNVVPQSRLAAPSVFVSQFFPAPNTGTYSGTFTPAQHIAWDQTMARLDHRLSATNQLFARWSFMGAREEDPN